MANPRMRYCAKCDDYSLADTCPKCKGSAKPNVPAKYSPEDHYGEYRRKLKKLDAQKGKA